LRGTTPWQNHEHTAGVPMKVASFAFVALLAMVAMPAEAVPLEGAGTAKCSDYLKFYQSGSTTDALVFLSWAQGYMSGLNASEMRYGGHGRDLASISTEDEQQFLHDYCQEHTGDDIASASISLYKQMHPPRATP